MQKTSDINVVETRPLPSPAALLAELPKTESQADFITQARAEIRDILRGKDRRFLLIVGPCSIHDRAAGREYASRLAQLAREVSDRMLIVMRVYFEKPRTTVGWKGLIMDPHLDGSHDIESGLRQARAFLREVLDIGLPTATELLDPITPQYISDLICWSAIGARTTESQTHRQMASGLSMPLGFKNGTDGSLQAAINAIKAARQAQTFLGVDLEGRASAVTTNGNPDCHIVLRGGSAGPNFSADHIRQTEALLAKSGLTASILVDCSHDNSAKHPERQPEVLRALLTQVNGGAQTLNGAMLESNLCAGNQSITDDLSQLKYGVSVTDKCVDWDTTVKMLKGAHSKL